MHYRPIDFLIKHGATSLHTINFWVLAIALNIFSSKVICEIKNTFGRIIWMECPTQNQEGEIVRGNHSGVCLGGNVLHSQNRIVSPPGTSRFPLILFRRAGMRICFEIVLPREIYKREIVTGRKSTGASPNHVLLFHYQHLELLATPRIV